MTSRKNRVRHLVRSAAIGVAPLVLSLGLTAPVEAATNARWNAGVGNWSSWANWDITEVPNNGSPNPGDTYNVTIDQDNGVPTVSIDQSGYTVESVSVLAGTLQTTGSCSSRTAR